MKTEKKIKAKKGESYSQGFCPNCNNNTGLKTSKIGYCPTCGTFLFHVIMCCVTGGIWFFVWLGVILASKGNKGLVECIDCGTVIQDDT